MKVLLLGSGAIKIGQAGEFDYSGSQAIKAFRDEGAQVVLINPNVATVQTTPGLADRVYLWPVEIETVSRIIEQEQPDAIALGFGGQTALNVGMEMGRKGLLDNIEILGTGLDGIDLAEDRERFRQMLNGMGIDTPKSRIAYTKDQAFEAAGYVGFPVALRVGFALGGLGSSVAYGPDELGPLAERALSASSQVLVEEYLQGWQEVEYEVVRDRAGNSVAVCNMENLDPMGIHTGDSIVFAPSLTLPNDAFHMLRTLSLKIADKVPVIGECNVQFAFNPKTNEYRVIELNPRLSRSSALASKATGYPLAYVAARLGMGRLLTEIKNRVTGMTSAFFEPAFDYITVKFPRWDLKKFPSASRLISTQMKSVGEAMAIGLTVEEALQKAVRSLGLGLDGLTDPAAQPRKWKAVLKAPTDRRLFALVAALQAGLTQEELVEATGITPFFIERIANCVDAEAQAKQAGLAGSDLRRLKAMGFSDRALGRIWGMKAGEIRALRKAAGVTPGIRRIDTLAGEFPAKTNYLYTTYRTGHKEVDPAGKKAVVVVGSGPYSIGSSVEFDACSVWAAWAIQKQHRETIMINSNPETVSTDYDVVDRLYLEEVTLERMLDIWDFEHPDGVLIGFGGQLANNMAQGLDKAGVNILGTSAESIDRAEDRHKFSALLDEMGVTQPPWTQVNSVEEALNFADTQGYPVIVRPSYVLSGSAMNIAHTRLALTQFLQVAAQVSSDHPVVVSKFIEQAKEIEVDAVSDHGRTVIYAISEHVELSGVHSGDSILVTPPQYTYLETLRRAKQIAKKIARALNITGPFNVQFLARNNRLQVIECNLRASRSLPFVSKVTGYNFADIATRVILGRYEPMRYNTIDLDHVGVKTPQFSFERLAGADPVLYVEMASTGEAACLSDEFETAFMHAFMATNCRLNLKSVLVSVGGQRNKAKVMDAIAVLAAMGIKLYATQGTHAFLKEQGIPSNRVYKLSAGLNPSVLDLIAGRKVDLVINIPSRGVRDHELSDGGRIRRSTLEHGIPLVNDPEQAKALVSSLDVLNQRPTIKPICEFTGLEGWKTR